MANEGYSILDVINDEYGVILTRNGCVSVAFRMYNPECYSLHRTDPVSYTHLTLPTTSRV
mgnify:CR=1 FL=1